MLKQHQEAQDQPFSITEDMATKMGAADHDCKSPGRARAKSARDGLAQASDVKPALQPRRIAEQKQERQQKMQSPL